MQQKKNFELGVGTAAPKGVAPVDMSHGEAPGVLKEPPKGANTSAATNTGVASRPSAKVVALWNLWANANWLSEEERGTLHSVSTSRTRDKK